MSQVRVADKKRKRALWPLLGFVLLMVLAVLAYVAAPYVIDLTKQLLPKFSTRGTNPQTVRLMFTILIFLVLGSLAALSVALFAPKKLIDVKEKDLTVERKKEQERKKMDKVRQRKVNRELKNVRRD